MKLANYYRTEENIFCRLINLDEEDLTGYDKVYVFSESIAYTSVPDVFKRAPNVIYGGTAFTNGLYVPFENRIIDYTLPHTFIYKEWLKDKSLAGLKIKETMRLLDNSYYRWHAGDEVLPLPAIRKRHRIYIYDNDFFRDGWRDIIKRIMMRNPSSINFIHPARFRKITDFLDVRENGVIAKTNETYLDLDIPLSETPILMKHYKNRILALVLPSSQVYLTLGGSFKYRSEYLKNIIYKLNLLYVFWSQNIPIKIKYEEPRVGCYNPIPDLSKLISTWTQGDTKNYKSIIDRIPKDKKMTEIRPEREQLEIILKRYPSTETLFRQTAETVKKGGIWKNGY